MANFDSAIETILREEGGYVNNPKDPGGETNFGISKASFPDLDIKSLTREAAIDIYHRTYWSPYDYDNISDDTVATKIFSLTVNAGADTSHRILCRALRALGNPLEEKCVLDGDIFSFINSAHPPSLLAALRSETAGYYRGLVLSHPKEGIFLNGWLKRAYS